MNIYHNSRQIEFRTPFGAAATESKVCLSVRTDEKPEKLWLRIWQNSEILVPMDCICEKEGEYIYSVNTTMPQEACLVWYCFVAEKNGVRHWCCKGACGIGETLDYFSGESWQITVYDKKFKTPNWFKNSIMYQIFPDRFYKKGQNSEIPGRNSEYIIHKDWYEPVFSNRHPFEDGPACNDFFGGNIQGIIEKLPYIKNLGISVIYLNPIFEAFSNHRYDTGDYSKIDPLLGTEEDFKELCQKAGDMGIKIILDGVFSHTGSDSIYFNKYGSYGENCGAYRDTNSPYRKWFQWCDGGYMSWWGCSNLPNVYEMEPTYIDYILRGEDAIIKKWLRCGAYGWRLDVADELPDEFIKILRKEVKAENPDAVVIGEVWEDASNKESYGMRRQYLLGDELDSVMNYPFKDNAIAFLTEGISAEEFADRLMAIAEHYPAESLYSTMNLLGTHDTVRIKNVLSGQYADPNMSRDERATFRLEANCETLAIKRLRLAAFMQMTFVGVPCIYYGDEIGMQGLSDPFNRMPYTWRCVDNELLDYYKKLTAMRNSCDCLRTGSFDVVYAQDGVFAYIRKISDGVDVFGNSAKNEILLCIVNRNSDKKEIDLAMPDITRLTEQMTDETLSCKGGKVCVSVEGMGTKIFVCR